MLQNLIQARKRVAAVVLEREGEEMLENPSGDSSATTNITTFKRYAPPNQRNHSLEKLERARSYANEGDKSQVAVSRNFHTVDHREASSNILVNENAHARLIYLNGCCESEAFRLLNDRWRATMDAYNNPSIDSGERPIMYSGSGASA